MRKQLLLAALVVVAGSSCSDGSPAGTGATGGTTGGTGGTAGVGGSTGLAGSAGLAGTTGSSGAGGSPGAVRFREGSFRAVRDALPVPRAPSIQGRDGLLLTHIMYDRLATSDAEAAGFRLLASAATPAGEIAVITRVFWKIAAGPAGQPTTEPENFGVANSSGSPQILMLFAVHGFDPATPSGGIATASGITAEMIVPGVSVTRPGSLGLWWKASFGSGTSGQVMESGGWTWVTRNQDGVNDVAWRPFAVGPTGDVSASQRSPSPWANVFMIIQPP